MGTKKKYFVKRYLSVVEKKELFHSEKLQIIDYSFRKNVN